MKRTTVSLTSAKNPASIILPDEIFAAQISPQVLATYIRLYRARQRSYSASAQTRGEVDATTAKVWRQKGTGRARHGSRKAPIFVGGGQAHGPVNQPPKLPRFPKKMVKLALASALTSKIDNLMVVIGLDSLDVKTQSVVKSFTKLKLNPEKKLLLILHSSQLPLMKAIKNLPHVTPTQASRLNAYEVLVADNLIATPEAINIIASRFTSETPASATIPSTTTKTPKTPTRSKTKTVKS